MRTKQEAMMAAMLAMAASESQAIENLKLSIQASNVVLEWPSLAGETYIVQHRPAFDTNTVWVTLTNSLPAALVTNRTFFVHSNVVEFYPGGSSGSGGGAPPAPGGGGFAAAAAEGSFTTVSYFDRWMYENREPYLWELEKRPPLPWEAATWYQSVKQTSGASAAALVAEGGNSLESMSAGCVATIGFYRVVRTGVHLVGPTNKGTLRGEAAVPVEAGIVGTNSPRLSLYVDGIEAPVASFAPDSGGRWGFIWNTGFHRNGSHSVYAEASFHGDIPLQFSSTNMVTLSNDFILESFTSQFGSQMWIYAELAVPVAAWTIDVFGAQGDYIGTFSDTSTDGFISFIWDLIDPEGLPRNDETFTAEFSLSAGFSPAAANEKAKKKYKKDKGGQGDAFVVAWAQSASRINAPSRTEELVQLGVVDILNNPAHDFPYELSPGNSFNGGAFRLNNASTQSSLIGYLADSYYANFFWYGHGNASGFGDSGLFIEGQPWIDRDDLKSAFKNRSPYRFVFLDGCNTAAGSLCTVFGIPQSEVTAGFFANTGTRSRAFLGAASSTRLPGSRDEHLQYAATLAAFFNEWMSGVAINGSLARAKQNAGWPLEDSYKIWGAVNLNRFSTP
jgi:hypothetical protein